MRTGWLCVAAVALALGPARAGDTWDFELRFWLNDVGGNVQATEGGTVGTNVDFEDDLGMDSDMVVEPRVTWNLSRRYWLRFSYANIGASGDQVSTIPISFQGTTYPATTRLVTDFDSDLFRLTSGWRLWNSGKLMVTTMATVGFGSGDASFSAPATALPAESSDLGYPYLAIGLGTNLELTDSLELFGEFGGLPLGSIGHLWDGEIGLRWKPTDWSGLAIGYKALEIKVEDSDSGDQAKLSSGGFFFMGNASW